jgi:hypothetical protein
MFASGCASAHAMAAKYPAAPPPIIITCSDTFQNYDKVMHKIDVSKITFTYI